MCHHKLSPSKVCVVVTFLSFLLLALACGAAATATPPPTNTPQPTAVRPAAVATAPAAVATATPAPAVKPAVTTVNPGKLTIMVGDLSTERFDPVFALATGGGNYGRIVNGFLISDNERRGMVPGIASQWGLSPDGLNWTFTMRKGVKFHDGSEVTAEDALWTLQHYFGPLALGYVSSSAAVISRGMDTIELSGPDKVSLTTKRPITDFAYFVSEASSAWWPIMPKRAKVHDTEEEEAYDRNPIGAGRMKLVKHVPASMMQFERFDDYYYQPRNGFHEDKRVNFQSLELFLAPEEATRVAAIRAGEADIVPASLATKKQVEAGGGRLVFGQEGVMVDVRLHGCYEPQYPCHDKRVRQALNYAIDKETFRDRLYGGTQLFQIKGWGGGVTPSTIGYTPELDPWPFDPDKARQLLADAGYVGGKGFGKLIVNTAPSPAMPLMVEGAQLVADMWRRELGLDVEVRAGDRTGDKKRELAGELKGQIRWLDNDARGDAQGVVSRYGDPEGILRLHEDPELFRLVQETVQILDADKRAEAYKKLYLRERDESYELSIGYANIPWGVGPRVLTWEPYPLSLHPSALHTITLK